LKSGRVPVWRTITPAAKAHQDEHVLGMYEVASSILVDGSMKIGFFRLSKEDLKNRSKKENRTRIYKINVAEEPGLDQKGFGFLLNCKNFAFGGYLFKEIMPK
jgi:hypothetical protein